MNTCLTCLLESKRKMRTIEESDTELIHKIEECGGVKIIKNEQYPDKICTKCYAALKVAYEFRVCCQKSQEVLRQTFIIDEMEIEVDEDVFLPITENDFKEFDEIIKSEDEFEHEAENIIEEDAEITEADFMIEDSPWYVTEDEFKETKIELVTVKSSPPKKTINKVLETKSKAAKKPAKSKQKQIKSEIKREKTKTKGPFMCHYCGHLSADKNCLNSHLVRHLPDEEKAHQCEICMRYFNSASRLHIHINTHTGQRPYKCKFCTMAFADPSTRLRHERVHNNIRPYKCEECQKTFTYSHSLNKHLRIHRGEKPYSCDYCDRRFTESHQKKAHENTHRKHMQKELLKTDT